PAYLPGAVRRGIVNDQDPDVDPLLGQDALDTTTQEVSVLVTGDDDVDPAHRSSFGSSPRSRGRGRRPSLGVDGPSQSLRLWREPSWSPVLSPQRRSVKAC